MRTMSKLRGYNLLRNILTLLETIINIFNKQCYNYLNIKMFIGNIK